MKTVLKKHEVPRERAVVFGSAGGMSTFLLTEHFNSVSTPLESSKIFLACGAVSISYNFPVLVSLVKSSVMAMTHGVHSTPCV